MGFLDTAANALGAADSILGGPQAPSAAQPDQPPAFHKGKNLGDLPPDAGGAVAPQDQATFNKGAPIEFIHFDCIHADDSQYFVLDAEVQDTIDLNLPASPGKRALMFRAALEREAILFWGFVDSCQQVLIEKENSGVQNDPNAGALGQAMQVASGLLGSGGGPSAPKSTDLNAMTSAVSAAGGQINVTPVTYTVVHKTGVDLSQARANYRNFLKNLRDNPGGNKSSSLQSALNPLSQAGDALSGVASAVGGVVPGIGNIFSVIQGIVFKAFDIYMGMFTKVAFAQEPAIEKASHDLTLSVIRNNYSPIYPAWFPKPSSGASPPASSGNTGSDPLGIVQSTVKDIKDFLDGPTPQDCPGTPFVTQAFSLLPSPPKTVADKTVTDLILEAFQDQKLIKLNPPDFLADIIKTISDKENGFLQAVYQRLLQWDPNTTIDQASLYQAARKRLLQDLVDLLISKVQFLQTLQQANTNVFGLQASPGKFLDRGEDALNDQLSKEIDPILQVAMGEVADQLESARQTAAQQQAATMEVYLGRLPWLTVLMFRDTFFPIWDLLVKLVFGNIGGPLSGAMSSASAFLKGARSDVHDVSQDVMRAKKVKDRFEQQGMSAGTGQNISKYGDDLGSTLAPDSSGPDQSSASSQFPIQVRKISGNGQIDRSQWLSVQPDEKWGGADDRGPCAS